MMEGMEYCQINLPIFSVLNLLVGEGEDMLDSINKIRFLLRVSKLQKTKRSKSKNVPKIKN